MIHTSEEFRKEIISYLDIHWEEELTSKEVSEFYGYSESYFNVKFKECFTVSFTQYIKKLRLRRAAKRICEQKSLTNIGVRIGFSSAQSFSKAFRGEFGVSPKQFLQSGMEIPDMPIKNKIGEKEIEIHYEEIDEMVIHAREVIPPGDNPVTQVQRAGYYHMYQDVLVEANFTKGQIGMFWHDEPGGVGYILGEVVNNTKDAPEGMLKVSIPVNYYAVFTVQMEEMTSQAIAKQVNEMAHFIYDLWAVINKKNLKKMAFVFEKYEMDKISLYVPIQSRKREQAVPEERGTDVWLRYIDKHIEKPLTIKSMAEYFNYSEQHFSDIFALCYNVRPGRYIMKRKLYLAASELRKGSADIGAVIKKYGFRTEEAFRRNFFVEFQTIPEEYDGEEYRAEDLIQYYNSHKDAIKVSYMEVEDLYMMGKNVLPTFGDELAEQDLVEYITYSMVNDIAGEQHTPYASQKGSEHKVEVWQQIKESEKNGCFVGPVVDKDYIPPKGFRKIRMKGGAYVVFESLKEADREELIETYRMLYRCAFTGWVKEYMARVDFSRITYVRYECGKLYFYIPITE